MSAFSINVGDLYVIRQKMTFDVNGERFPVRINFTKELSDEKLQQLAVLAKWIQDKEEEECNDQTVE